jgi:hypothetical protein
LIVHLAQQVLTNGEHKAFGSMKILVNQPAGPPGNFFYRGFFFWHGLFLQSVLRIID